MSSILVVHLLSRDEFGLRMTPFRWMWNFNANQFLVAHSDEMVKSLTRALMISSFSALRLKCQRQNDIHFPNGPEIIPPHFHILWMEICVARVAHLVYIFRIILPTICRDKQTTNRINIQSISFTMRRHRAHPSAYAFATMKHTKQMHFIAEELLHARTRTHTDTYRHIHTHIFKQHPPFDLVI